MTDPNTPVAVAQREAEVAAAKTKALRDIAIILASDENRIDHFADEDTPDISPRLEMVVWPVYIGIWLYQNDEDRRWAVEINTVKDDNHWLEDGVERDESVQNAAFRTFKDALDAANGVIKHLSTLPYFNDI